MECLKVVGAKPGPLPLRQVMELMKEYIMKRQLFDHSCPARILCGQDPLGKVFGVEQFLVNEVVGLLVKQMYAVVPRQHVVSQVQTIKRQQSQPAACSDATAAEASKRARLEAGSTDGATNQASPMRLFIPSSPVYSSGTETEYSVQGRETDVVKDTSDDLWFLEESSDEGALTDSMTRREALEAVAVAAEILRREAEGSDDSDCPFEVEYEIEESDQDGSKASTVSSDSDIEDLGVAEIVVCVNDDDAQFWADSSDSYSSDSEIGEPDLWQCRLCGERCEPRCLSAVQRYCAACWQQRFGWLPDRVERHPPQKKRRRVQRRNSAKRSSTKKGSLQLTTIEVHRIDSAGEEGSRSVSRSDESVDSAAKSSDAGSQGSEGSWSSSSLHTAVTAMSSQEEPASQQEEQDWSRPGCSAAAVASTSAGDSASSPSPSTTAEMCTICLVRPKCAILIHGRTSHRLTCYKCALQLQKSNLPCPVCRRRIQRVVRNFDA